MAHTIITTNRKDAPNWSGKEWSKLPAKIYSNQYEALDAIRHYWYGSYNLNTYDHRPAIFRPLTEKQMIKMIHQGRARL